MISSGEELFVSNTPSDVLDAAMTPDGKFVLTATKGITGKNGSLRLWNLSTHKTVFTRTKDHVGRVEVVALVPGGRALSGGEDGQAVLWDLEVHRPIFKFHSQKKIVRSAARHGGRLPAKAATP